MPVYSLLLSTSNGGTGYTSSYNPISDYVNNKTTVSWNINWDNVFQGDNLNYKFCAVRYHLSSDKIDITAGTNDWNTNTGLLVASFTSKYQENRGANGVVLDIINPSYYPNASAGTMSMAYNQSTLSAGKGLDINVPTGTQILTINLNNDIIFPSALPISSTVAWNLFLTFELY
jgi:hypothetical protein